LAGPTSLAGVAAAGPTRSADAPDGPTVAADDAPGGDVGADVGAELAERAAEVAARFAAGMDELADGWTEAATAATSLLDWDDLAATVQRDTAEAMAAAWRAVDGSDADADAETRGPLSAPIAGPSGRLAARLGFLARVLTDVTASVTAAAPIDLALAGDELGPERRAWELARGRTQAAAAVSAFAATLPAAAARRLAADASARAAVLVEGRRARAELVASLRTRPMSDAAGAARVAAIVAPLRTVSAVP
jgi:hypothetical protein